MKHYTSEIIEQLFSPKEVIEIIKNGIEKYANGQYHIPERMHIQNGPSTKLLMPAFSKDYFCTKLISVDPQNKAKALPVISGLLVLNKNSDGSILATMDAPSITALRTSAIGSIGLELINPQKIQNLGIIGLGVQGLWQTIFALSTQKIDTVYCTSRSQNKFSEYAQKITARFPEIKIHWCDDGNQVVEHSDVIIACTTSTTPVFQPEHIHIDQKRFLSIGSFRKDMQELPKEVFQKADIVLLDTKTAIHEVGDIINPLQSGTIREDQIISLAELFGGKRNVDSSLNVVFKSVGMAAFDLSLAIAIHEKTAQQ